MPTSSKRRLMVFEKEERRTLMVSLQGTSSMLKGRKKELANRLAEGGVDQFTHDRGQAAISRRIAYVQTLLRRVWPEVVNGRS